MGGNWEQNRRDHLRTRRIRIGIASVAALVVGLGVTNYVNRTPTDPVERIGSGAGSDRPIDTSPFTLPRPQVTGLTTIPGGPNGVDLGQGTAPGQTPTPTVTLPPEAKVPDYDPVCSAIGEMYQLYRDANNQYLVPVAFGTAAIGHLNKAAEDLELTDKEEFLQAARVFRNAASRLSGVTDLELIGQILIPLLQGTTPEARAASKPLNDHALANCPDLIEVHTE